MSKNIAIVTGASSGMGKEFALSLKEYDHYDEVWVIARSEDKLKELESVMPFPIKVLPLDLTKDESLECLKKKLEEEKPLIKLLVNASGYGGFASVEDIGYKDNLGMVDLNVRALVAISTMAIPYMTKGSQMVQFASLAAYQPIPYMACYGASKSFVIHFSRALNRELKPKGIHVMTVCPYWTKTNFFNRAETAGKKGVVKKYIVMYEPEMIVNQALKDLKKRKEVSIYGFIANGQVLLCKLLPHDFVMKVWLKQQGLDHE